MTMKNILIKRKKNLLLALFLSAVVSPLVFSDEGLFHTIAMVDSVRVDTGGYAMIYLSEQPYWGELSDASLNTPEEREAAYANLNDSDCRGKSFKNVLAINLRSEGGSEALALALTAHTTKATVEAQGTGSCEGTYGPTETLDFIHILR